VRIAQSGQRGPFDDFPLPGIDFDKFVLSVHSYEDFVIAGVVDRVSSAAAEGNRCHKGVVGGINHRVGIAVFV